VQPLHRLAQPIIALITPVALGCVGCGGAAQQHQVAFSLSSREGARVRPPQRTSDDARLVDQVERRAPYPSQRGLATWYGPGFGGKSTTSGEIFDPRAMTAAHRALPFGTWVDVVRLDTGQRVRVRINDRGPWGDPRRVIDLSQAAAERMDLTRAGVVPVEVQVLPRPRADALSAR
jgi:rare lipoprotein A